MVERKKIFCNIELTKNDIFLFRLSTEMLWSYNQDKKCFQKLDDTLQERVNALRIQPLFGRKHRTAKHFFVCKDNTV